MKTVLSARDVNEIVRFLLQLGGWYDPEGAEDPEGAPSTKKATFESWIAGWANGKYTTPHAPGYPLTRDMVRLVVLRRLADAYDYIEWLENQHGLTRYGEVVRSRAFDYDGDQRWPLVSGRLTKTAPRVAGTGSWDPGQRRITLSWGLRRPTIFPRSWSKGRRAFPSASGPRSGSTWPLATFFPENGTAVRSFFRIAPGNRVMAFEFRPISRD